MFGGLNTSAAIKAMVESMQSPRIANPCCCSLSPLCSSKSNTRLCKWEAQMVVQGQILTVEPEAIFTNIWRPALLQQRNHHIQRPRTIVQFWEELTRDKVGL